MGLRKTDLPRNKQIGHAAYMRLWRARRRQANHGKPVVRTDRGKSLESGVSDPMLKYAQWMTPISCGGKNPAPCACV